MSSWNKNAQLLLCYKFLQIKVKNNYLFRFFLVPSEIGWTYCPWTKSGYESLSNISKDQIFLWWFKWMHLSPTLKFKGNKIKHTDTVVKLLHCYLFVINDINDMINDKIYIFKNHQRSILYFWVEISRKQIERSMWTLVWINSVTYNS